MKAFVAGLIVASIFSVCAQADECARIATLRASAPEKRADEMAALWKEVERRGTPLVDPIPGRTDRVCATFLFRDAPGELEPNIGLMASFLPGGSRDLLPLERLPGTDVLQASLAVEATGRFRYYFAWPQSRVPDPQAVWRMKVNSQTYELFGDPLSRLSYVDDFDGAPVRTSYFDGPAAPAESWLHPDPAVSPGSMTTFEMHSRILDNTRRVSVYTPAGYRNSSAQQPYPLLVLFDREGYLLSVPTATILDNLIAEGSIPPLVAVLVSAIDGEHRTVELAAHAPFASFVVDELLPRVRSEYRVTRDPRRSVVAGSSLGGLTSSYIAYSHPEAFGNVLSLSGSYWWHPAGDTGARAQDAAAWLPGLYATHSRLPLRFYVTVGTGEGEGMLGPNRVFRDVLTAKGNPVRYEEFRGDHSYLNWRDGLVSGLQFLLAPRTARSQ